MICLGLESTAHTFGAAVVTGKKQVLSDVRDTFTSTAGGMIPLDVAKHHKAVCHDIVKRAITEGNQQKIDLVAYSAAPGLAPCLHVGLQTAKDIAQDLGVDVIGVNHAVAHLSSAHLFTPVKDPVYLYISGANTQLITREQQRFAILGETLDIALGNALDKFARVIGLGFPGGPEVEKLALNGKYVKLPYVVKGMDVSFSGLVTHLQTLFKKGVSKEDLCYSFQETAFAMVTEVAERALSNTRKTELVFIGGVAANKRLSTMLTMMCEDRWARFFVVPMKYAADNAAMIAYQGILEYTAGRRDPKPDIRPYERTDEVKVIWNYL